MIKQDGLPIQSSGKYHIYTYYFMVAVYILSAIPSMAIFVNEQKSWEYWLALILAQFTPHIEYYILKKTNKLENLTKITALVPAIVYGFFWGATGFIIIYGGALFIMILTCIVTAMGPKYILQVIIAAIPAAIMGGYVNGFVFKTAVEINVSGVICIVVFIFLTLYGTTMNSNFVYLRELRRKLAQQKQQIERVNSVIVEASASFSIEKIMQVILNAVNEHNNFNSICLLNLDKSNQLYQIYGPYINKINPEGNTYYHELKLFIDQHYTTLYDYYANQGITLFKKESTGKFNQEKNELFDNQMLFNSLLSIPLVQKNKVIGIAILFSTTRENLKQADIDYISKFISQISAIISNTLLHLKAEEQKIITENKRINYEQIANELSVYLSPQIYKHIFERGNEVDISSRRKYLTVFLSELTGYTNALKTLNHEITINLLNNYLDQMYEIARQYGATIDKYMGDNMLIFFGDPDSKGNEMDAINCVSMALAMRKKVKQLQLEWHALGIKDLSLRIGINSGYCNVGNFGSHHHMEYTLIGNNINLASRIQNIANPEEILIGESTYLLIHGAFECQELGKFRAKGVSEVFKLYQVIGTIHEVTQ